MSAVPDQREEARPVFCGAKCVVTVQVPLAYPSYGWEPKTMSVVCDLLPDHSGDHRDKDVYQRGDEILWA